MILFDYLPSCVMYANIFSTGFGQLCTSWIVLQEDCYVLLVGCDEIDSIDGKMGVGLVHSPFP